MPQLDVRRSVHENTTAQAPPVNSWAGWLAGSLTRRRPAFVMSQKTPWRSMSLRYIGPDRGSTGRIQSLLTFVGSEKTYNARIPCFESLNHRLPSGPSTKSNSPLTSIFALVSAPCPGYRYMSEPLTTTHRV